MEHTNMNHSLVQKSEYMESSSFDRHFEHQSLHNPFASSRKLERGRFNPYATAAETGSESTLPGIEIPDKPQNWPREGEKYGEGFVRTAEHKKKPVKLNCYEPSQWIPMGERVLSIHPVNHELGSEVLGVRFERRIEIYALRLRTVKNDEFFTLQKIQEFMIGNQDFVSAMAIGFNSNIGIGGKKLAYAFALHDKTPVYYVKDEPNVFLPFQPSLTLADTGFVKCFSQHSTPIHTLKFDGENGKYLAVLGTDLVCKVWNVETGKQHSALILESEGVAVHFHRAESNKIMIAERSGWIKIYNLKTMAALASVFATATPLYTAEWSPFDPNAAAAGVMNKVHLFRQINRNCELVKTVESRGLNTIIRLCPSDRFIFATFSKFKNDLRVFHSQRQMPIWTQLEKEVQWIEWVYGKPFLMACVGENIEFYEATAY